jgi:REP element-mobilizing transposase RayT
MMLYGARSVRQTLKRLDKGNTYCVLVMPDHVHLLTAPLEREKRRSVSEMAETIVQRDA